MMIKPIDIANQLDISTSTLRNYETKGLVPIPARSSKGYRIYTDVHVAYFTCIKAMEPGFGMDATSEILRYMQCKEMDSALRIVNEVQANLHRDTLLAESNIQILETEYLSIRDAQEMIWMTIGEVAEETSLPRSTIRHWEKVGLILSSRDPENGYRRYSRSQLHKIMLLRTLRPAVYSLDLIGLKQAIAEMDPSDIEHAKRIAHQSLQFLFKIKREQLSGVYNLYKLCRLLNLID
ncbi:MerR family DNA-binding transcriptional regulator [Paenibacillus sp. Soil750]|uniref:MerR family DNA-binding transcriptional regulator n=1 Tax=Paenibacillus sp. Soil750 TaxID=1736398 RepID=UPI0006FCDBD0|nr:MerR family DNA-binding transcriptional regulator [Paenibacillus sp. Soil750]KRE69992.1 transcriptional regulator [Paenibacillus sp. Soil750]